MSLVQVRRSTRVKEADKEGKLALSSSRNVLVMYPGERISFSFAVNGPPSHRVSIYAEGFPQPIGYITINPRSNVAPFTSEIEIRVNEGAASGLYKFDLHVIDNTWRKFLGAEPIGILILPKGIPRSLARHYRRLRSIYEELGAQGVLWYLIEKVFRGGASFTQLKNAYELIRGDPVKNPTVVVTLKRLAKKNLIMKGEDRKYHPLVTKEEIAFSRIDRSRVRIRKLRRTIDKAKESQEISTLEKLSHEPYVARLALKRAQKIAQKHNKLTAAYFLIYSLVGARETGYLLLWFNAMFVFCEQKTGFCHYFYSELLSHYFQMLGLNQGIMYRNTAEYQDATQVADRYIRKYYGSHQVARRIHYKLKREEYIYRKPDAETLNVEILHYEDGDMGVRIWDNEMEKIKHEENVTDKPIAEKEIKPAYPYEHIYEPNEETYFHRPGGIY